MSKEQEGLIEWKLICEKKVFYKDERKFYNSKEKDLVLEDVIYFSNYEYLDYVIMVEKREMTKNGKLDISSFSAEVYSVNDPRTNAVLFTTKNENGYKEEISEFIFKKEKDKNIQT